MSSVPERADAEPSPTDGGAVPTPAPARRARVVDLGPRTALVMAAAVVGIIFAFDLVQHGRRALTWLVLGTLFAMALDPVVAALGERLRLRRSFAVAVVSSAALAIAVTAIVVLAPLAAREAGQFQEDAPQLIDGLGDLPLVGETLRDHEVPDRLRTWATELPERLNRDDAPLAGLFESAVGGLVAAVAVIGLTVAALLDGPRLVAAVRRVVPSGRRAQYDRAAGIVYRTVGRYFAGSLVVALLSATCVLVVGLLVGIPLVPLVAVWVSVTNLIPQIGGLLGGSAFVLAGAAVGPTQAVICLAWFLGYQQLENHVISPLIVGEAVDLSPSVTMIGALLGAATAGVPGALVAIPTIGAVKGIIVDVQRAHGLGPEPAHRSPSPWRRLGGRLWRRRHRRGPEADDGEPPSPPPAREHRLNPRPARERRLRPRPARERRQ